MFFQRSIEIYIISQIIINVWNGNKDPAILNTKKKDIKYAFSVDFKTD